MKQTGDQLKSARENRNLSLHEIGMSLKINPKTLQAIEEGDVTKLPPKTFLRGFVKSYAQFLKLDAKALLDTFDTETNGTSAQSSEGVAAASETATPALEESRKSSSPILSSKLSERAPNHIDRSGAAKTQRVMMFIGGILLVAVIVIVARLVNKYQKERGQAQKPVEIAQPTPIPTIAPVSEPVTSVGAEVVAAPSTAPSSAVSAAPAPTNSPALDQWTNSLLTAPPPKHEAAPPNPPTQSPPAPPKTPDVAEKVVAPVVVEKPAPPKAKEAPPIKAAEAPTPPPREKKVTAAAKVDDEASAAEAAPVAKPQEVIVEASGKVQISYSLGGGEKQSVELNADEIHTFKSKSSIALDISDGDAVSIIVNGRDKGKAGKKAGEAIHLSYPK